MGAPGGSFLMPGPSVAELWSNLLSFPLGSSQSLVVHGPRGLLLAVHLHLCDPHGGTIKCSKSFCPMLLNNCGKKAHNVKFTILTVFKCTLMLSTFALLYIPFPELFSS